MLGEWQDSGDLRSVSANDELDPDHGALLCKPISCTCRSDKCGGLPQEFGSAVCSFYSGAFPGVTADHICSTADFVRGTPDNRGVIDQLFSA